MRTYSINLPAATGRRQNIIEQARRFNLDLEIVEGVDGRQLTDEELRASIYDPDRNQLAKGEIGCALSHLRVYEKFLSTGDDFAYVTEDDLIFTKDPTPFLAAAVTANPEEPLVFLDAVYRSCIESRPRKFGSLIFYPAFDANSAFSYVISRAGARNLLNNLRPVRVVADYWKHFILCGLIKVWVCEEIFAVHSEETRDPGMVGEREERRRTKERKLYTKRVRAMAPLANRLKFWLWKYCVKPFEKIAEKK